MESFQERSSLIGRPNGSRIPASSPFKVKSEGRKPLFSSNNNNNNNNNGNNSIVANNTNNNSRIDENRPPPATNSEQRPQSGLARYRNSIGNDAGGLRRAMTESQHSSGLLTPGGSSKIPMLRGITSAGFSSGRKSLSLKEAWELAPEGDDDPTFQGADASPSPAPREWRDRRGSEGKNMRTFLRGGMDSSNNNNGGGGGGDRPFSRASMMSLVQQRPQAQTSPEKTEEYRKRLYGQSRLSVGAEEHTPSKSPGRIPVRVASNESMRSNEGAKVKAPTPRYSRYGAKESPNGSSASGLPELVPGIEDLPLPSIESDGRTPQSARQQQASARAGVNPSPEKSFAWQIDADFTAGELQISDSPRIRMQNQPFANRMKFDESSEIDIHSRTRVANPGSRNTKLDEIRNREVKSGSDMSVARAQRNTKLDDIQAREAQVEAQYPIPDRNMPRPRNLKLDEIKQREIDGVSRRAFAQSRLEEIREQNLMARARSPDLIRPESIRHRPSLESMSNIPLSTRELSRQRETLRPRSAFEMRDERSSEESEPAAEPRKTPRPRSVYGTSNTRAEQDPEPEAAEIQESGRRKSLFDPASERLTDTPPTAPRRRQERAQKFSDTAENEPQREVLGEVTNYERPVSSHRRIGSKDSARGLKAEDELERKMPDCERPTPLHRRIGSRDSARGLAKAEGEQDERQEVDERPATSHSRRGSRGILRGSKDESELEERKEEEGPSFRPRADSRDVLRQLARATGSSPVPDAEPQMPASTLPAGKKITDNSESQSTSTRRSLDNDRHARRASRDINRRDTTSSRDGENSRPTVGFVGLGRNRSRDSTKSKRSSMQSESDPTDRIEAEMKLFAPGDNLSAPGSTRAPSPGSDEEDGPESSAMEMTPKTQKPDPLTMPTPRIMGAFVETPATVRVERREIKEESEEESKKPLTSFGTHTTDWALHSRDKDAASKTGTDDQQPTTATYNGLRRQRARSLPRRRGPLRNTAKLPSVRDDLMEIQRTHHIDDSTLDDLEEVLSGRRPASPRMQALIKELPNKPSTSDFDFDDTLEQFALDSKKPKQQPKQESPAVDVDFDSLENSDTEQSEGDLARYERMGEKLKTSLLGIRSSKQGMQRLSDQFHVDKLVDEMLGKKPADEKKVEGDKKPAVVAEHSHADDKHDNCTTCTTPNNAISYLALPLPRLYRRRPSLRLTFLGIVVLLASLWYAAESAMCSMYCRPESCSTTPCVWSFEDPTFGVAIPVKLDQWITNGRGRAVYENLREEVGDAMADLMDKAYGRDVTDVDMASLSFEQKRQHRRRLQKKGLLKPRYKTDGSSSSGEKAKWDAWVETRAARDKARDASEMEFNDDYDLEPVGDDDKLKLW